MSRVVLRGWIMVITESPVVSRFMDACIGLPLVEGQRCDSVGVGIVIELLGWNVVVVVVELT